MMQDISEFVARWSATSDPDRDMLQRFLMELCDVLDLPGPQRAQSVNGENTYTFERNISFSSDTGTESRSLDLYKKGCFFLNSMQCLRCGSNSLANPSLPASSATQRGTRVWEESMLRAKRQAEQYARSLPRMEDRPRFLIVVDVGYCFDLYSDFSCTGSNYQHFPDARRHRVVLDDLVKPEARMLFRAIWTEPSSLDPSTLAAEVTEKALSYLAILADMLEDDGYDPGAVSQFLMRCIFSMFAEDVGLLPSRGFAKMLESCLTNPMLFPSLACDLWDSVSDGRISAVICQELMRINTSIFADPKVIPLRQKHMLILAEAAKSDWSQVEPAIFGTLLERALDPKERHKLGAHYTPRAYVERLVIPTLMDPLRKDWKIAQAGAYDRFRNGKAADARKAILEFHTRLSKTRVLDPACGSGNFLYVAMDHMMRLEAEILQTLESYGEKQPPLTQIDPHQFLGLEINTRATQIAEMVLWIGYLRWHFRAHGLVTPPMPVIRKFGNIQQNDAVIEYAGSDLAVGESGKPISRRDRETYKTDPATGLQLHDSTAETKVEFYKRVTAAKWPVADFIVGNPPFVGGKDKKQVLGREYFEALRTAYPMLPVSCDFVMYWWHKAAELLRAGKIQRFGFITTSSISQVFNRRVIAQHMDGENPLRLVYALPDHPWVDAPDGAVVRIALTVAEIGSGAGTLATVERETSSDGREIGVILAERAGIIHPNLRQGANLAALSSLAANRGLCTKGVILDGSGFIVTAHEAAALGLGRVKGLERHIRQCLNGKDVAAKARGVMVIDLHGLSAQDVRDRYPEVYHWVLTRVKPGRDQNRQKYRRDNWWLFAGTNAVLRDGLAGLPRYISTIETSKHRFFVFLPAEVLPDNKLVNIASDDAYHLGVLSSRIHVCWTLATGGKLGVSFVYIKSICFDAFPFPDANPQQKRAIRKLAEKLDAHRKSRQNMHPDLTMTGMYNALEAVRAGRTLTDAEKTIHQTGLVSTLLRLHDELDAAVADAYGWPNDLPDEDILLGLVELNAQRAEEEKQGNIRLLRPGYQTPGAAELQQSSLNIDASEQPSGSQAEFKARPGVLPEKSEWPVDPVEQVRVVCDAIASIRSSEQAVTPDRVAEYFTGGSKCRFNEILCVLETVGIYRL